MTDTAAPRRRKRSAVAGLTAVGAAAMLSGCDAAPDEFGKPTDVSAFRTVAECVATGDFTEAQCTAAQRQASIEDAKAAPRFEDRSTCEDSFGFSNCAQRTQNGQSFFVPLLTGFMIGQLLDGGGNRYRYSGLYRDREGGYYSGTGAWLSGGSGGYGGGHRYQIGSRALTTPITTQRVQTRSSVVSRGGFGGRASARASGGWGGSRGFGG